MGDCQARHVFGAAEQYRCAGSDSEWTDLIAEPAQLMGLPAGCFDFVVVDPAFAGRADLQASLLETQRVLSHGGYFLVPAAGDEEVPPASPSRGSGGGAEERLAALLAQHFAVRRVSAVDPVTGRAGAVELGLKDAPPCEKDDAAIGRGVIGYPYHPSRKAGRRIVFCLDGSLAAGDELPVETLGGEVVGRVEVGADGGGRDRPPEPWREGFRLPPRAVHELDPATPSGVYKLAGRIPFVHRGAGDASVAVLIPSHTAAAFNISGGACMYRTRTTEPSDIVSFLRPAHSPTSMECESFLEWFAAANPRPDETTYLLDSDMEEDGALDGVEVLIVLGRSEYWTRAARERFDAFVDGGGRALLLCSELMYWQVRVDLVRHELHAYKDKPDPCPDPKLRTMRWQHPSLEYPVYPRNGCELRYGGYVSEGDEIGWDGFRIVAPGSPLLAGSGLAADEILELPDATVWDGAPVSFDEDGQPTVDFGESPPWHYEVIGYNLVKPAGPLELSPGQPAVALWIALRRSAEAGTVVHGGTFGWCGPRGVGGAGPDSERIRGLVLDMLALLLDDAWPFSTPRRRIEEESCGETGEDVGPGPSLGRK